MNVLSKVGSVGSVFLLSACGAPDAAEKVDADGAGEVQIALTSIPASIQCLQITAVGSSTIKKNFAVTSGSSSVSLNIGKLPLETQTFSGVAYDVSCGVLALNSPQIWVSNSVVETVEVGRVSKIKLDFKPNSDVTALANFSGSIAQIVPTNSTVAAVLEDGTVRTAGYFLATISSTFVQVPSLTNVKSISLSSANGCSVHGDGTLKCWGTYLGDGTITDNSTPTVVQTASGPWTSVAVGFNHRCAISSSQGVRCWGVNTNGQLGTGTTTNSTIPTSIAGISSPVQMVAGFNHTCARTGSGTVYCWGHNAYGQVGNGTTVQANSPVQIGSLTGIVDLVAGGYHTCARRADGAVYCWGYNGYGQIGNGTITNALTPQLLNYPPITELAAGNYHTCFRQNSSVSCFGSGAQGQLGDGKGTNSLTATALSMSARRLWAGVSNVCVLLSDLSLSCWGENGDGQLGDGTRQSAFVPTRISL